MQLDRLVHMINQIGSLFATQDKSRVAEAIAEHLRKFWDPRMRAAISAHLANGSAALEPATREGIALIAAKTH